LYPFRVTRTTVQVEKDDNSRIGAEIAGKRFAPWRLCARCFDECSEMVAVLTHSLMY
jgi:hypothetical protein